MGLRFGGVLDSLEHLACGRCACYMFRTLDPEVHPSCIHGLLHFFGSSSGPSGYRTVRTLPPTHASDRDFVDYTVSSEQLLNRIGEAIDEIGTFLPISEANRAAAE
jgi:hypothetical protein